MRDVLADLEYQEWAHAEQLREDLSALGLPDVLLSQISFRHTDVPKPAAGPNHHHWPPPWPGCCTPPGIGSARIWGDFVLAEWFEAAPHVFGPGLTPRWAAELDAIAANLRRAAAGSRTLWALDLLHPVQHWRTYEHVGLAVQDLVQWGPALPADLLAEVDAALAHPLDGADDPWGRPDAAANKPESYHGQSCFVTYWCCGV